jgi:hypothetical protein
MVNGRHYKKHNMRAMQVKIVLKKTFNLHQNLCFSEMTCLTLIFIRDMDRYDTKFGQVAMTTWQKGQFLEMSFFTVHVPLPPLDETSCFSPHQQPWLMLSAESDAGTTSASEGGRILGTPW